MNRTRRIIEGWYILGRTLADLARLVRIPGAKSGVKLIRPYLSRWFHGHHEPGKKQAVAIEAAVRSAGLDPERLAALSEAVDAECDDAEEFKAREIALLLAQRKYDGEH